MKASPDTLRRDPARGTGAGRPRPQRRPAPGFRRGGRLGVAVPSHPASVASWFLLGIMLSASVRPARAVQEPEPALEGWVVEQIWMSPMAGAQVVLMDDGFRELDRTVSDADGRFRFPMPAPGAYNFQARADGHSSALVGPVEVGPGPASDEIVLQVVTARALSVVECFEGGDAVQGGVVLGVAHEVGTDMALPGARIVVSWTGDEGGGSGSMEALADDGGRYHLCGVPAGTDFTIRTEFLGQTSASLEGVVPGPGAVVRSDIPLDLGASAREGSVFALRSGEDEAEPAVLSGTLVDATTGRPVPGALVRMPELDREVETDPGGRFRFEEVEAGRHPLEVEHLAYGVQRTEVELSGEAGLRVDLRVTPRALALEGIAVTARRRGMEERGSGRPFPARALAGEKLALLDRQGTPMLAAIREVGVGLRIREGRRPGQACIEAMRRATGMNPGPECQMVVVVLDGVPVLDPSGTLSDLRLADLESIEYLSPLEAGFRYGLEASARGALVLWSRGSGPYRNQGRDGGD